MASLKSLSLWSGLAFLNSAQMVMARSMKTAIRSKSFSTRPRVVMAGAPTRRPWGTSALLSPGTVFLLQCRLASSMMRSALAPSTPLGLRSTSTKWLSVPPETSTCPIDESLSAIALLFLSTCVWYTLNSGVAACLSATARAVMVWLWGPPWRPGNTAWLMGFSRSYMISLPLASLLLRPFLKKIMAPRGPRRDLCVVVVTTSAYSKGLGTTPAATRPEMCAMSAMR
mmetsp:Transcript_43101/g.105384  ORF Transcript_43101/g.105384 Transcript_43101/m.105384 type:complete len:227 (-) Transcript_43101:762-1442(-)